MQIQTSVNRPSDLPYSSLTCLHCKLISVWEQSCIIVLPSIVPHRITQRCNLLSCKAKNGGRAPKLRRSMMQSSRSRMCRSVASRDGGSVEMSRTSPFLSRMDSGGEGDEMTALLSPSLAADGMSRLVSSIGAVEVTGFVILLNTNLALGASIVRFSARRSLTSRRCCKRGIRVKMLPLTFLIEYGSSPARGSADHRWAAEQYFQSSLFLLLRWHQRWKPARPLRLHFVSAA